MVTTLGLSEETRIAPDTCILETLPQPTPETTWQELAAKSSPLLKQATLGIEASREGEKLIRAERIPTLALFAGNHLDGPIIIEVPPINKNFNYWYAGIGLKFNIAAAYKTTGRSREARLNTQKNMESRKLLEDNLRTGVKEAYVRYCEAFTTYQTQIKSRELAVQNYTVVNNRYLNDLALITDMLDASTSRLNAELQVVNARINILFNYYKLKRISGNL